MLAAARVTLPNNAKHEYPVCDFCLTPTLANNHKVRPLYRHQQLIIWSVWRRIVPWNVVLPGGLPQQCGPCEGACRPGESCLHVVPIQGTAVLAMDVVPMEELLK